MPRAAGLTDSQGRAIKVATRCLVQATGGSEATAAALGTSAGRVDDYYAPQSQDRWMRVDQVPVLEALSGFPHITTLLARLAGYRLVPMERAAAGDAAEMARAMAKVAREAAETMAAYAEAAADGRLGAAERARMAEELQQLITVAGAALAVVQPED